MIRKLAGSAALAVAVLAASPLPASAAPQWEITATPDTSWRTSMRDVATFPDGDAWAVGSFEEAGEPIEYTSLVWRWDGTRWNDVSPPSTSVYDGLAVVTGSSGDDAWAFGGSGASYPGDSVVWRWDGRTWTRTTLPRDQGNPVVVHDAAMVGGEVWAVGSVTLSFPTANAAVLRWNGTGWSRMAVPVPSGSSVLNGMRVVGPNDIWAAGWTKAPTSGSFTQPFVVHWDGTRWSRVPTPVLNKDVPLSDVEVRGAGEVWVAGSQGWMNQNPPPGPHQPFLMRWNGQSWTQTPAPSSSLNIYLSSLGLRDGQLWAVGTSGTVLTWNGQSWQPGPTPPEGSVDFSALTSGPNGTLWAAGNSNGPFLMRLTG
nr:hypothetical protein [uncultured bacterium]